MDEQFKIRSYGYGELAMLYFPNSAKKCASVQFRRWIIFNKKLAQDFSYIQIYIKDYDIQIIE